jgi:carboxylesterase
MTQKPYGVLMLHGFPANPLGFKPFEYPLGSMNLPYRIPSLRGMGEASPSALLDVTWHDWLEDASSALDELRTEANKVIIIGHSMGGALALMLASDRSEPLDSLILAAPGVQLASPFAPGNRLHFLLPLLAAMLKKWNFPPSPLDGYRRSYPWAPKDSVLSLIELSMVVRPRLKKVKLPTFLVQGRKDDSVSPTGITIIRDGLSTPPGQICIRWFERSGHDIFFDEGGDEVVEAILEYIRERITIDRR